MKELNYETEKSQNLFKTTPSNGRSGRIYCTLEQGEYLDTVTEFLLVPDPRL